MKLFMLSDGYKPSEGSCPPFILLSAAVTFGIKACYFFKQMRRFTFIFTLSWSKGFNVPKPPNCAVNGCRWATWSRPVQGHILAVWEQSLMVSIAAFVSGEPVRLSHIYHWGRARLLFYLQFLKLKMSKSLVMCPTAVKKTEIIFICLL